MAAAGAERVRSPSRRGEPRGERPAVEIRGLGYPAIIVGDMDRSLEFYQRAFGMRLLYVEPNRDDEESVQALLHAGNDSYVLLVGPKDPNMKLAESSLGVSSMQYLALSVSGAVMDRAFYELANAGVSASEEIRRGYERLVFLEDPSGVLIILSAWATEPPAGMSRAEVLEQANRLREAQGSPFVEDAHVRQAIEELSSG